MLIRNTLLKIEAELFAANAKRIKDSLKSANPIQKKYQREFAAIDISSLRRIKETSLYPALARYDVIFVGDYRCLADSKKVFVHLISEIKKRSEKPVFALVDWMASDRQRAIDAFYAKHGNENELPKGLFTAGSLINDFASDYVLAIQALRQLNVPLAAIDADAKVAVDPVRRDSISLLQIEQARNQLGDGIFFISVGDSRLGEKHLPGRMAAAHKEMTIAQVFINPSKVYFKGRGEGRANAYRNLPHFCIGARDCFHVTTQQPLYVQQAYLNWLEGTSGKPCDSFNLQIENQKIFATLVALFLGKKAKIKMPRILYWEDLPARLPNLNRHQTDAFLSHLKRGESFCLPEKKVIFISNKLVYHVGEELCHYIKAACDLSPAKPVDSFDGSRFSSAKRGRNKAPLRVNPEIGSLFGSGTVRRVDNAVDYLYRTSLHEMFGFLGSKFIDDSRQVPTWDAQQNKTFQRAAHAFEQVVATTPSNAGKQKWRTVSAETLQVVGHHAGYRLGEKIFQLYCQGKISSAFLTTLTHEKFNDPHRAKIIYHELKKITQK